MSRPFLQRKRTWIAIALLAGAALVGLHGREIAAGLERLDWRDVQAAVRSAGPWAPLVCIALNALFTMLFLPTTLVCILVALLFGLTRGFPICLAGLALGMAGSFCVARYLARDWIERRIGHTRLFRRLEENMRSEGWQLVFFTRLLPINPYGFLNYAYGLTRLSFGRYIVASTLGVIPNVLALMWTAKAAGKIVRGQMDWHVLAILFAGAGLFAVLAWLPKLLRRRNRLAVLPDADEPEADED
ncbi:MAG: TVP38/TMEM64 family protein [Kiritimatiellia bacterium]